MKPRQGNVVAFNGHGQKHDPGKSSAPSPTHPALRRTSATSRVRIEITLDTDLVALERALLLLHDGARAALGTVRGVARTETHRQTFRLDPPGRAEDTLGRTLVQVRALLQDTHRHINAYRASSSSPPSLAVTQSEK